MEASGFDCLVRPDCINLIIAIVDAVPYIYKIHELLCEFNDYELKNNSQFIESHNHTVPCFMSTWAY